MVKKHGMPFINILNMFFFKLLENCCYIKGVKHFGMFYNKKNTPLHGDNCAVDHIPVVCSEVFYGLQNKV